MKRSTRIRRFETAVGGIVTCSRSRTNYYEHRDRAKRSANLILFLFFCVCGLENVKVEARTSSEPPEASPVHSQSQQQPSQQQSSQQPLQQQQQAQQYREAQVPRPSQQPSTPEKPAWGYGLDLIGSQASAFWQNYQGQFAAPSCD